MFINSDFSDLLRIFNDNNVRYIVIGGYAVIQHAEPRFTKDLDLWISTDPSNAKAVYNSLRQFGAPLTDMTEADFSEDGYFYQMGNPPVRVDILMGIPGIQFDAAWERRVEADFNDVSVLFISRSDLITALQRNWLRVGRKIYLMPKCYQQPKMINRFLVARIP